jgi:hypothetical protein
MQPYKGIHAQWMNISTPPPYRDSFFDAILRIGLQVPPHARVPLLLMSRRCDLVKHTGEARRRIRVRESRCTDAGWICPRYLWHVPPCCRAMLHAHWVRHRHAQRAPNNVPAARGLPLRLPRLSPRRNADPHCVPFLEPCTALCAGTFPPLQSPYASGQPRGEFGLNGKKLLLGREKRKQCKNTFLSKKWVQNPHLSPFSWPDFLGLNQHDYIFAHLARIISQTRECRGSPSAIVPFSKLSVKGLSFQRGFLLGRATVPPCNKKTMMMASSGIWCTVALSTFKVSTVGPSGKL